MTKRIPAPATVADLMAATGLGRDRVRQAIREGQLPGQQIGRSYVIPAGEFAAYIEGRWEPKPKPAAPIKPISLVTRRSA